MLIAVLSTLISSIALVGVAVSLLLQARQLRVNQMQVARASQVELIKFCFDNPAMAAEFEGAEDTKEYVRNVYTNLYVAHLSICYENRFIPKSRLQIIASDIFKSEATRKWWVDAGPTYYDGAASRRTKEFFAILQREFQQINGAREFSQTATNSQEPS